MIMEYVGNTEEEQTIETQTAVTVRKGHLA
jgi:hypothetical protein